MQIQIKSVRAEYSAIVKLLDRSNIFYLPSHHLLSRNLCTSIRLFEKQQSNQGSESNKNESQKESSSSGNSEKPSDDKKSNEKRDNDDKKKKNEENKNNDINRSLALLTKAILWTCLLYSFTFTLLVISSILTGGKNVDSENYTVSWKEFVQYMLASGEVQELVIRPQYDHVRIVLHDGAIINGRRARFTSYLLTVPSAEQFEHRLREVEKRMGIHDGKIHFGLIHILNKITKNNN